MKSIFAILSILLFLQANNIFCEEIESFDEDLIQDDSQGSNDQATVEVKVTPPKSTQPQIQSKINDLQGERKNKELKYLQEFKKTFENEIISAGKQIEDYINKTVLLFDDPEFFNISGNYKRYEPMTFTQGNQDGNMVTFNVIQELYQPSQNKDQTSDALSQDSQKKSDDPPRFKEVDTNNLDLQDQHIEIPPEDKIMELMNDNSPEAQEKLDKITKQLAYLVSQGKTGPDQQPEKPEQNKNKKLRGLNPTSFLQMDSTESVTVKFHQQKEVDPQLVQLIEALESDRSRIEESIFEKANKELQLITNQTMEELRNNMEAELLPFFITSNDIHVNQDTIYNGKMETLGLIQLYDKFPEKMKKYFPTLTQRIEDLRKESLDIPVIKSPFDDTKSPNIEVIENYQKGFNSVFFKPKNSTESSENELPKPVSFLQLQESQFQVNDNLNVKLSSDVAYPTIFKKIAFMEAIRDGTEKKEMDKILQIESHLQKIQGDMIQSAINRALTSLAEKIRAKQF